MKDEHFETAMRRDGFDDVRRRSMPAGTFVAEHTHEFDVRALVLDGEITLITEGEAQVYRAGDIFVLPAGHRHAESVGAAGVEYLAGCRHVGDFPLAAPYNVGDTECNDESRA